MKIADAKKHAKEFINTEWTDKIEELADLILWAYDKGWSEGIEDYLEEIK